MDLKANPSSSFYTMFAAVDQLIKPRRNQYLQSWAMNNANLHALCWSSGVMFMHALWMEESAMLDPYSQPCPIARMDWSVDHRRYL